MFFVCCNIDRADEEEEEPVVHGTAPTSTSNTLVLSKKTPCCDKNLTSPST
jgi:hypothetical protein